MTIQEIALILLEEAYNKMTEYGYGSKVNVFEVGKKNGISEVLSKTTLNYLNVKNFIRHDGQGGIYLTNDGIDAYETRKMPNTPLYQSNQFVINAGRDITTGVIQQGSSNIMQKLTYEQIFQRLELEITNSNLKDEEKKTLLSKLKDLISHPLIIEFLKRLIFGQLHL